MKSPRRAFLQFTAATAATSFLPRPGVALDYPTRPVRLIVGFPAGTSSDITARLIAQWLSQRLGQQFIVENRPGAGTNLATELVAHASSDGYTLLWVTQTNAINASLFTKLNFDFAGDIAPVAAVIRVPAVMLVSASFPAKTVPEFIAYAKVNPGKIDMCSPGIGSANHVFGELFEMMAGVKLVHVPYRGSWFADLMSGQVQVTFNPVPASLGLLKSGKVRALAVTAAARQAVLPDVPTLAEFVPGYEATAWFGIGAPTATASDIVGKLNTEIDAGLADAAIKARLATLGGQAFPGSSAVFKQFIAAETTKWAKVIRFANIKAD
jgi:tripartite-type tricarboxylate transporter receptor subunit TctC